MRNLRVGFVGHDASRTGAPGLLASFLRWLVAEHPELDLRLLLLDGGPLEAELRSLVPTRTAPRRRSRAARLAAPGLRSVGAPQPARLVEAVWARTLRGALRDRDLVVANTLAAVAAAADAAPPAAGVVCVVHELDGVADRVLPPPGRARVLERVDRFVAAGPAVADLLTDRWHVRAERVRVVRPFVDPPPPATRPSAGDADHLLVLSVGAAGPRKGTDRFVDLVASWPAAGPCPRFVWVGGDPTGAAWSEAVADVAAAGVADRCRLVPTVPDARSWIAAADVVVSTAREDPYPLALVEAAVAGVPVVAMDAGGARDLLAPVARRELLVGNGDVLGLRNRVARLIGDAAARAALGEELRALVGAGHLTEVGAPALWDALRTVP